jgi:hypothetical protein
MQANRPKFMVGHIESMACFYHVDLTKVLGSETVSGFLVYAVVLPDGTGLILSLFFSWDFCELVTFLKIFLNNFFKCQSFLRMIKYDAILCQYEFKLSSPPLVFWDKVSLCSPVWPQIQKPPAFTTLVLRLQACTTTPSAITYLRSLVIIGY